MDTLYYVNYFSSFFFLVVLPETARWVVFLSTIWLPISLIPLAWKWWVRFANYDWQMTRKYVVLEIKLPQETIKSPAAMELAMQAFIQTGGEGTPHERYWQGKARPWASLEFCVINGEIRFFIWCFEGQRNTIVSAMYGQYPDIEIHEVEDYTKVVVQNPGKYDIWACQYDLIKSAAYPITTYVDYGLSDDPDEELKVDPLVSLLENMATVHKDDQVWFQFIIRAHKKEANAFNKSQPDAWMDDSKAEIKKIIESASVERAEDGELVPSQGKMTKEKQQQIELISRNIAKAPYDVGIRCIQIYQKGTNRIRADLIKGAFRQFGSNIHNSIKPDDINYNYYWQDPVAYFNLPFERRDTRLANHLMRCYRLRSFFFYPYRTGSHFHLPYSVHGEKDIMVMNGEALATLWHFPGSTARVPALKRLPSKRADAPSNLPV